MPYPCSVLHCFCEKVRKESYHCFLYCNKPLSWDALKIFSLSFILSILPMICLGLFPDLCVCVCVCVCVFIMLEVHLAFLVWWLYSFHQIGKALENILQIFFSAPTFFFSFLFSHTSTNCMLYHMI